MSRDIPFSSNDRLATHLLLSGIYPTIHILQLTNSGRGPISEARGGWEEFKSVLILSERFSTAPPSTTKPLVLIRNHYFTLPTVVDVAAPKKPVPPPTRPPAALSGRDAHTARRWQAAKSDKPDQDYVIKLLSQEGAFYRGWETRELKTTDQEYKDLTPTQPFPYVLAKFVPGPGGDNEIIKDVLNYVYDVLLKPRYGNQEESATPVINCFAPAIYPVPPTTPRVGSRGRDAQHARRWPAETPEDRMEEFCAENLTTEHALQAAGDAVRAGAAAGVAAAQESKTFRDTTIAVVKQGLDFTRGIKSDGPFGATTNTSLAFLGLTLAGESYDFFTLCMSTNLRVAGEQNKLCHTVGTVVAKGAKLVAGVGQTAATIVARAENVPWGTVALGGAWTGVGGGILGIGVHALAALKTNQSKVALKAGMARMLKEIASALDDASQEDLKNMTTQAKLGGGAFVPEIPAVYIMVNWLSNKYKNCLRGSAAQVTNSFLGLGAAIAALIGVVVVSTATCGIALAAGAGLGLLYVLGSNTISIHRYHCSVKDFRSFKEKMELWYHDGKMTFEEYAAEKLLFELADELFKIRHHRFLGGPTFGDYMRYRIATYVMAAAYKNKFNIVVTAAGVRLRTGLDTTRPSPSIKATYELIPITTPDLSARGSSTEDTAADPANPAADLAKLGKKYSELIDGISHVMSVAIGFDKSAPAPRTIDEYFEKLKKLASSIPIRSY